MKILLVKTTSMGDVIHALPVAYDIKKHFPEVKVHWLVERSFADLPRASGCVDKVIESNLRNWKKNLFSRQTLEEFRSLSHELKAESYDLVIDLQGLLKSAIFAKLTGSQISGYDRHSIKEPLASLFYNNRFSVSRKLPAIERNRRLASLALDYPYESELHFGFRGDVPQKVKDFYIFFVNTSRETKLWPEEDWVKLAQGLPKDSKVLLPWGNAAENERVLRLQKAIGERAIVEDRLPIGRLIERIQTAEAVVGLDTGMTHLSAALGVPTVGIFRDYPVELVPLEGEGPKVGLGGVDACPSVQEVRDALVKVTNVSSKNGI